MQPVRHASVTENEGIVGDCRGKGGLFGQRQVTLTSLEQWLEACDELGVRLPAFARRANICISGYSFGPTDVGKKLVFLSGLILEITGETKPCSRMDEVCQGLRGALEPNWRGGVTCRVIKGGDLDIDTQIEIC